MNLACVLSVYQILEDTASRLGAIEIAAQAQSFKERIEFALQAESSLPTTDTTSPPPGIPTERKSLVSIASAVPIPVSTSVSSVHVDAASGRAITASPPLPTSLASPVLRPRGSPSPSSFDGMKGMIQTTLHEPAVAVRKFPGGLRVVARQPSA